MNVKIANFDIKQGTCVKWKIRREQNALEPEIAVETFRMVAQAQRVADSYDLLLYDGQPHSTAATLEIARICDKILLPTGLSTDDLEPSVLLAHELVKEKILPSKFVFVLCRVGNSESEILEARDYIKRAGYKVLDGELPEKGGYRRALGSGRAFTETTYPSLRAKAEKVAQSIVNFIINKD